MNAFSRDIFSSIRSTMIRMCASISDLCFFFSSRRRHTRFKCDWSSDVCSSDLLQAKLQDVFHQLRGEGKITPEALQAAMRQIRLVLLEADVQIRVVKPFVERVRERALGAEVMESLTPAQQVIKVVRDELTALLA